MGDQAIERLVTLVSWLVKSLSYVLLDVSALLYSTFKKSGLDCFGVSSQNMTAISGSICASLTLFLDAAVARRF